MTHPIIRLLRPHQYIKNGFVFLGPIFAVRWDVDTLGAGLLVFLAFCAAASAIYVFNDLTDIEADRAHPRKCKRPLASGEVSAASGWRLTVTLAILALIISASVSPWAGGLVAAYIAMNIGYTLSWKHIVVVDVFLISTGFMLRILAGTQGLGITPSPWLLLCGLMVTLFLGFAKRRAELLMIEDADIQDTRLTRRVLDDYNPAMIEQFMAITAACTILSYSLYTVSGATIARHDTAELIYTVPFVVYGVFRYIFLLHRHGHGDDTASTLTSDPHLLVTVAAWVGVTIFILA
ncbi:MAG: decaprenyl-phosphate phosphoribosyltransferase [Gammaproteobacteria bacterium]|nr:decaprenyl-phosphate phosphoribosyltransferase [Gammaproteobacteria bacterium]MCP5135950.1 decaprenyl-phosphate phosphoribosyltransferase [Gammaproteobacteria bacterium]